MIHIINVEIINKLKIGDTTMETEILSNQVLDYIINDVETTIHRLGINAQLSIKVEKDYRGNEYEKLVSTSFQTMPMLFKEIHLEGSIAIRDKVDAPDDFLEVHINLDYYYHTFDNGSNGHTLGRIVFEVDKRTNEKMKESGKDSNYISMIVRKVQSLEI